MRPWGGAWCEGCGSGIAGGMTLTHAMAFLHAAARAMGSALSMAVASNMFPAK